MSTPEPDLFGLYANLGILWQQLAANPLQILETMAGSPLEWAAVITTFLGVLLAGRQNIWSWPIGLVGVVLFSALFWQTWLVSDALLQGYFFVTQFYGWYFWVQYTQEQGLPGTKVQVNNRLLLDGLWFWKAPAFTEPEAILQRQKGIITFLLFGGALALAGFISFPMRQIGAALPFWDSLVATLSIVAQYLLARKVPQAWLFWILVNIVAIGVYSTKGLYPTTALYIIFLFNAIYWALKWNLDYRRQAQLTGPQGLGQTT